ncbi:MAG: LamG-like jellyroll fold domain-containing protein [Nocardioides sp.]|uniref:LamG-like jellyroll fold domain-containing protein n=1 Tax=Nocardioides sp. TaxID=35761 RepID=UPI003D6C4E54
MSLRMELGFPEGSGTTTADSSGVGNNCTVGGGGWATGHTGGGYAPTGTDEVTFPALGAAGGNVFSVMGWVRRTGAPGSGTVVCDIGTSAGTRWAIQSNGSITALSGRSTGVIPDGTWTHVAFVANATTARTCYVNGVQVDQDTGSQSFLSASATYHLTSNATAWLQWDDFRVFDHALTEAEVDTWMADTVGGSSFTGTLTASLPALTVGPPSAAISGTAAVPVYAGDVAASTPTLTVGPPTSAISGTVTAPAGSGDLVADLPTVTVGPPTMAMSGTVTAPTYAGDLAAATAAITVGPPTMAWTGTSTPPTYSGTLDASTPTVIVGPPMAAITGTVTAPGSNVLAADLPSIVIGPPTSSISGTVAPPVYAGALVADLPVVQIGPPVLALVGTVEGPPAITGTLVASLPTITIGPVTAAISDTTIPPLPVDGVTLTIRTGPARHLTLTGGATDLEVTT